MSDSADYDRATTLVHEIGSLLVNDPAYRDSDWDGIAVVTIVEGGTVQVSGYTYRNGDKPKPSLPRSYDLDDRFEELCNAMQTPDGGKWKTALVKIRRDTGKITIDYDYDNPLRWKVTPLNLTTLPEEMRPK